MRQLKGLNDKAVKRGYSRAIADGFFEVESLKNKNVILSPLPAAMSGLHDGKTVRTIVRYGIKEEEFVFLDARNSDFEALPTVSDALAGAGGAA